MGSSPGGSYFAISPNYPPSFIQGLLEIQWTEEDERVGWLCGNVLCWTWTLSICSMFFGAYLRCCEPFPWPRPCRWRGIGISVSVRPCKVRMLEHRFVHTEEVLAFKGIGNNLNAFWRGVRRLKTRAMSITACICSVFMAELKPEALRRHTWGKPK